MSEPEKPPTPADPADPAALAEALAAARERCVDAARADARGGLAALERLRGAVDGLVTAVAGSFFEAEHALAADDEWASRVPAPYSPLTFAVIFDGGTPADREALAGFFKLLDAAGLENLGGISSPGTSRKLYDGEGPAPSGRGNGDEDYFGPDWRLAARGLEMRFMGGSRELYERQRGVMVQALRPRSRQVIEREVEAALARHKAEGGSVCRMEPDLVANPGGLADFRALGRIGEILALAEGGELRAGRGLLEEEDFEELGEAASLLAGCRIVLHGLAGRPVERLDREHQVRLAAALGYRSGEEIDAAGLLMRDVFRAMRVVGRALKVAVAQHEEERSWGSRRKTVDRRRPLGRDFIRIGKRLYLSRPDLFEGRGAGLRMLRGFGRAASARLGFSQEFLKRVRDNLYMVGEEVRESAEAGALFREILAARGAAAEVLRPMHESGFLGAYLPEFAEIDCLVTGETGQEYTVDEQALMTVAELDRMELSAPGTPEPAARLVTGLPLELVKLAGLLHAIGKSRGAAGFAARGAVSLPRIAGQLGLAEAEARLVIFLVENQLLLAEAAGSRMTTDERLLDELAEAVAEPEYLDALYLLTLADLAALGRGGAAAWRVEQLGALHKRLSTRLSARPARSRGRLAEELAGRLPASVSRTDMETHLAQVPERYLLEVSPGDAARHLELLAGMSGADAVAVDWRRRRGHVHFWVLSSDRPRRISQIAGAILASGASIVSARAYTRADGVIIDQFDLVPTGEDGGEGADEFWERTAETIRGVLSGLAGLDALVEAARARGARGARAAGPGSAGVEAHVAFDDRVSADYTVVDVACPDRPGLVYALSAGFSDAGADIAFAKINTVGGVARDVFYVTVGGAKVTGHEDRRRIRSAINAALRKLAGG